MKLRELASRANITQRTTRFKVIASILVAGLTIAVTAAIFIAARAPDISQSIRDRALSRLEVQRIDPGARMSPVESARAALDTVLTLSLDGVGQVKVLTVAALVLAALAAVVWLGLGLTYLGLLALAAAVALPLALFEPTQQAGLILLGLIPLTFLFLVLMQLAGRALSYGGQITAIARNVLSEAVRMKISLVFIVLLIILLAFVPTMLNEDQPLRFRVQQWLQYGTGISFALLALLTAFFACATISFEQRDRIIWQTMSKPVAPWRYIVGKWLGIMALNAVLLTVVASGVYLFTEFLRRQPANGEIAYQVRRDESGGGILTAGRVDLMSDDRRILETQVLVSRVQKDFDIFVLDPQVFDQEVAHQLEVREQTDMDFVRTAAAERKIRADILIESSIRHRTIEPGGSRPYTFEGLGTIRENWIRRSRAYQDRIVAEADRLMRLEGHDPAALGPDSPISQEYIDKVRAQEVRAGRLPIRPTLTLQYKINSGSNDPAKIFTLGLLAGYPSEDPRTFHQERLQVALKQRQYTTLPVDVIAPDGTLRMVIGSEVADASFTFPPDGLRILYAQGSYTSNFARVMVVMWIKLGFIAAVAIATSTGLSFAVSSLCTIGVLFMAESSGFLAQSLEYYFTPDPNKLDLGNRLVQGIGRPVVWTFDTYTKLRPTESLVDGLLLSWGDLGKGIAVIGIWTGAVLIAGILIFRKRELATYSGH